MEGYEINKLEDMPRFIPIIYIRDTHFKDSTPRMVGNDIHDELVIESGGNYLYYYNLQCGESSHNCSDFRFVKREAVCFDDEFYSKFCQMVDLEGLIEEHDKQLRKRICERLDKIITKYLCGRSGKPIRTTDISSIIKQVQGETNGI